jgi:ubiquitin C-terminal hydrolase
MNGRASTEVVSCTKVVFPLQKLDMYPWIHRDYNSPQCDYNLAGVICHHGTAGGGHYTSYCLNPDDGQWYHPAQIYKFDSYFL